MKVTVYAASSPNVAAPYVREAEILGAGIASRGWTLVYGGADVGLMGACANAALREGGRVEGVILDTFARVAHQRLHQLEFVTNMRDRKRGLAHGGDAYVVLPGGFGTLEEFSEILVERQLDLHRRPLILVNARGFWDPILTLFDRMLADGLVRAEYIAHIRVVADAATALSELDERRADPPAGPGPGPRAG